MGIAVIASDVISTHAGRVSVYGGIGTILGGLTGTDVIIAIGIIASVLGVIFGIRREMRETKKYNAEMRWMRQQGAKIDDEEK